MGKSIAELKAEGRAEGAAEVLKNLGISQEEYQEILKNKSRQCSEEN